MASETILGAVKVKSLKSSVAGKVFPVGTKASKLNDVTKTAVTVPAVFTAPATLPEAAKLTDLQAIQTEFNKLITDITNTNTRLNGLIDVFEAFGQSATS